MGRWKGGKYGWKREGGWKALALHTPPAAIVASNMRQRRRPIYGKPLAFQSIRRPTCLHASGSTASGSSNRVLCSNSSKYLTFSSTPPSLADHRHASDHPTPTTPQTNFISPLSPVRSCFCLPFQTYPILA